MKKIILAVLLVVSSAATAKEVTQEKTDEWIALKTRVSKLSREQNNGKLNYEYVCKPSNDRLLCAYRIDAFFDGHNYRISQADYFELLPGNKRGAHIGMFGRAVCDMDVHVCRDFDTGEEW